MSIATQLQAYEDGLGDAYDMVAQRGGTMPAQKNLANLDAAIATIPSGGVCPECPLVWGKVKYHPMTPSSGTVTADTGTVTDGTLLYDFLSARGITNSVTYNYQQWASPPAWMTWFPISDSVTTQEFIDNGFIPDETAGIVSFTMVGIPPQIDTSTTLEHILTSPNDWSHLYTQNGTSNPWQMEGLTILNEQIKEVILGEGVVSTPSNFLAYLDVGCPYYVNHLPEFPPNCSALGDGLFKGLPQSMTPFYIEVPAEVSFLRAFLLGVKASGTVDFSAMNYSIFPDSDSLYSFTDDTDAYINGITIVTGNASRTADIISYLPDQPQNNKYRNLINGDL